MLNRETCEALRVLPEVRGHEWGWGDFYWSDGRGLRVWDPEAAPVEWERRLPSMRFGKLAAPPTSGRRPASPPFGAVWAPTLSDLLEMAKDNGVALECNRGEDGRFVWDFGWTRPLDPGVEGIYNQAAPEEAVAAWLLARAKESSQ